MGAKFMHKNWFNQDGCKTKIKFIKISFHLRLITFWAFDADIFRFSVLRFSLEFYQSGLLSKC